MASAGESMPQPDPMRAGPVRIVVVAGDPALRKLIVDYFIENQICAVGASSRQDMMSHLANGEPDLVILDRLLGSDDGLDLLRDIRFLSEAPGVIVTGDRTDEIDRAIGLELGADDYVPKPFGLRELLARVRAVLRRRAIPTKDPARSVYRFGGWQLDSARRRLTNPDGAPVLLTKGEYDLLVAFLEAPQRPLTRAHLLDRTRTHEDALHHSINVRVLRLRRKLEDDPSTPRIIRAEYGIGYVFDLPVEKL